MDIKEIALKICRRMNPYSDLHESEFIYFANKLIESYKAELLNEVTSKDVLGEPVGLFDVYNGDSYIQIKPEFSDETTVKLYTFDQVAAVVLKVTGPLEHELRELRMSTRMRGEDIDELRTQLAAAQEEIRSRDDFIAMLQETQKDQLASCEQRVAEWQPIETAPRDGTRILMRGYGSVVVAGWGAIIGTDAYGWRIVNDAWIHQSDATH